MQLYRVILWIYHNLFLYFVPLYHPTVFDKFYSWSLLFHILVDFRISLSSSTSYNKPCWDLTGTHWIYRSVWGKSTSIWNWIFQFMNIVWLSINFFNTVIYIFSHKKNPAYNQVLSILPLKYLSNLSPPYPLTSLCSRVSQPWHYWYFWLGNSLLWEEAPYIIVFLAEFLASTYWMPITATTTCLTYLGQLNMSPTLSNMPWWAKEPPSWESLLYAKLSPFPAQCMQ